MKTEGSHLLPHPAANAPSTAVQRAVMNRHNQNRRAMSGSSAKPIKPQQNVTQPPRSHSLQTGSPVTTKPPTAQAKAGAVDAKGQTRPQPPIQPRTHSQQSTNKGVPRASAGMHPMTPSTADGNRGPEHANNTGNHSSFYPPEYQAHLDQLGMYSSSPRTVRIDLRHSEQDYDAHADMLEDDASSDSPAGAGSTPSGQYPRSYAQQGVPPGTAVPMNAQSQPPMQHSMQQMQQPPRSAPAIDPNNPYAMMNVNFDPYDPNLDADPFGLTASMHFPTQFTYQESSHRR